MGAETGVGGRQGQDGGVEGGVGAEPRRDVFEEKPARGPEIVAEGAARVDYGD